jgi:hypothetical protein
VVDVVDRRHVEEVLLIVEDSTSGARVLLPDEWGARFAIAFAWDAQDRLWVNSSDLGTFAYQRTESGWRKLSEAEQKPLPEPRWK